MRVDATVETGLVYSPSTQVAEPESIGSAMRATW